ncbi:MAG: PHP domain-containing protein [Spirochaetia bacterium]
MSTSSLPYVPLHLRSYFSLLRGCRSPEELCAHAAGAGYPAAGLADINNLYGAVRFIAAARREGIKPIIGAAIEYREEYLFTAYCLSKRGFGRLNRLLTSLFMEEDLDPAAFLLEEGWEGLAIISPRRDVLSRLITAERARTGSASSRAPGIYAALFYGVPFRSPAAWAAERRIPVCAVNGGVALDRGDPALYRLLRAIDRCTTVDRLAGEPGGGNLEDKDRIVDAEEMERFFSAVPEALENAARIAAGCEADLLPEGYVFPRFQGLCEKEAFGRLKSYCLAGIDRRYGPAEGRVGGAVAPRAAVRERLRYELDIVCRKRFAGYFLVVHDIVSRFPRTCGRGSSAASIISYLLGITHVDPLKHNLFFERFLNMGRTDPPDIDVDFPWDERDRVLAWVFETYRGRAGMVADHVTFGPRSCYREPAKAFGMTEEEIGRIVRAVRLGDTEEVPPYVVRAARRLRGIPRYIGMHPGGVVITPGPITDYTHLQISTGTGLPVIAWEKDAAEDAGLVKIDLLGNRSLGVLRDCIELITRNPVPPDPPVQWESFDPLDDTATRELIEAGNTLGVFYVESPATRQLLHKMGHGDFERLVMASSIIRPAANKFIRMFVSRLKGEPYRPLHPLIADTLAETKGIMVYQEDVARVAIAVAGFDPAEADRLRKTLSKKDREYRLKGFRKCFFEGGAKKGVPGAVLEQLWDMILSFDGYSFCKAHSASYALLSYRLAWMKRHYPLEFFTAVINNGGGFYSASVYLNEVRRLGYPILPPDVNRSCMGHTAEYGRPGAGNGAFRLGLSRLSEVPREFSQRLLAERKKNGSFTDFSNFLRRTDPPLGVLRYFIRSGALDSIAGGLSRPELFWAFFHRAEETALFGLPPVPASVGDYSDRTKLVDELKTLGVLISLHPLTVFESAVEELTAGGSYPPRVRSREVREHIGERISIAGILVTGKEVRSRTKRSMGFLSFEDPQGIFETVLFPEAYERLLPTVEGGAAFFLIGTVEEEFDTCIINVRELIPLRNGQPIQAAGKIGRY